ncbi:hypothetical protein F6455_11890 [Proteobacteria bacterium 005FR1]|nr:hypothetical protein [Proteobacteria bacterium 005FR1]
MASKDGDDVQVLERGHIYFLYRPRVEEHEPSGQGDLQQFYIVLSPHGKKRYRLGVIGREKLPDPSASGKERFWGFIDAVESDGRKLVEGLTEETYQTKTRGTRHQPAARPAGEGKYQILRHGDHTHLIYALELPRKPGDVQKQLNIEEEGSYIISIRNPDKASPPLAGLPSRQQARFPKNLQRAFRDRKFADADPPEFLDHEGAEFVMIAAAESPREELGIHIETERESRDKADIFRDLHLHKSEHPIEPLFKGEWR